MALYQKVFYQFPTEVIPVEPQATGGGPLGSSLFITPRVFTYNEYHGQPGRYNLALDGLAGFMAYDGAPPWNPAAPYSDAGWRIVTKLDGTMSLEAFMEAIAQVCIYGIKDEGYPVATLQAVAKQRRLEMRCEPTTDFVNACATSVGLNARKVRLVTATVPNGFDDGHVLTEAREPGGAWKLFDISSECAWADASGALRSLHQVISAGVANCVMRPLGRNECANDGYIAGKLQPRLIFEELSGNPLARQMWCERVYQIPGWDHPSGEVWWWLPPGTEHRQTWLLGLQSNYRVKTEAQILAAFY